MSASSAAVRLLAFLKARWRGMKRRNLYVTILKEFLRLLNGYIDVEDVESSVVAPELGDEQGVKGAISLCLKGI